MITNIFPPEKSLKNLIINILLTSDQADIKQIKKQLKKTYSTNATYQGIHKILNTLKQEKVLNLENHQWQVDQNWIDSTIDFLKRYKQKEIPIYTSEMRSVSLRNMGDALQFLFTSLEEDQLRNGGEHFFITHFKNIGFFLGSTKQEALLKRFAKNNECHVLVEKNNLINKLCARYLRKIGVKVYLGIPRPTPYTISVYGNTVFYTFSNSDVNSYLTKEYGKISKITDIGALRYLDSLKEDTRFGIKFTFETDKDVVEQTKKYLLGLIKK